MHNPNLSALPPRLCACGTPTGSPALDECEACECARAPDSPASLDQDQPFDYAPENDTTLADELRRVARASSTFPAWVRADLMERAALRLERLEARSAALRTRRAIRDDTDYSEDSGYGPDYGPPIYDDDAEARQALIDAAHAIHALYDGTVWTADTLTETARILRMVGGLPVRSPADLRTRRAIRDMHALAVDAHAAAVREHLEPGP